MSAPENIREVTEKQFEDFFGVPVKEVQVSGLSAVTNLELPNHLHSGTVRFSHSRPPGRSYPAEFFYQWTEIRIVKEAK